MGSLEHLADTDGIGHRHQFNHAIQAALPFKLQQAALERHGNPHPWQFVGMQRGLDISLARPLAKSKHR